MDRAVYGPRDGTVLSQQLQHRSDDIPEGEATITLEDVQIIWALPIDGLPVTGLDIERSTEEWQIYCREYLGFSLDEEAFKGSRLHTHAIMNFIRIEITHDTPRPTVVQYTRCIAMLLLGGLMCPDSSGNMVSLLYLSKLEEINAARNYSWGSVVLAFYTGNYVMLVSKAKRQLVIWAWSRIIPLFLGLGVERLYMDQVQVNIDRFLPAAPYGAIWNCRHNFTRTFIWQPYDMDSDRIIYAADFTPELWRSTCPLIFYVIVEIHHPERVLRQFETKYSRNARFSGHDPASDPVKLVRTQIAYNTYSTSEDGKDDDVTQL
ncbi:UNVERIFIED_CONTAM: Serine/threonine-protein phosphatase 7 long form [Sesamum radiatum]|uniref:Serine/threonine-protein phosphatase 7 long form n=1 Tax=Sesamum radiatum TaxID=300843 RepID=A0AAW2TW60_SESRA